MQIMMFSFQLNKVSIATDFSLQYNAILGKKESQFAVILFLLG